MNWRPVRLIVGMPNDLAKVVRAVRRRLMLAAQLLRLLLEVESLDPQLAHVAVVAFVRVLALR